MFLRIQEQVRRKYNAKIERLDPNPTLRRTEPLVSSKMTDHRYPTLAKTAQEWAPMVLEWDGFGTKAKGRATRPFALAEKILAFDMNSGQPLWTYQPSGFEQDGVNINLAAATDDGGLLVGQGRYDQYRDQLPITDVIHLDTQGTPTAVATIPSFDPPVPSFTGQFYATPGGGLQETAAAILLPTMIDTLSAFVTPRGDAAQTNSGFTPFPLLKSCPDNGVHPPCPREAIWNGLKGLLRKLQVPACQTRAQSEVFSHATSRIFQSSTIRTTLGSSELLRRRPETILILSFAAMFAVGLLAHWALASDASPHLREMYLSNNKRNSITMIVDNFLPAAILGIVSGWVGYQWTTRKLNLVAVFLAVGVTCVHFAYHVFFPGAALWWWPPEWGEGLIWFGMGTIFVLFFSHFGRNLRRHRKDHAS